MTRSQFVRNTTETILNQLPDHKRLSTAPARASTAPKGKLTSFPSASSPNLSHTATSPNLSRSGSLLRVGQATGMARNPSAQSLEHGAGRPSKDSTRTAERLSWSLFDEKVGPFGGMASLGSQSAWEAQLECFLKVLYSLTFLIKGSIRWYQEQSSPASSDSALRKFESHYYSISKRRWIDSECKHFKSCKSCLRVWQHEGTNLCKGIDESRLAWSK